MTNIHETGDVINSRYEIVGYIGAGGMQEVYLANDRTFNRSVALKVPKNPSAEKRFRRSAILSARVNHPNVAKTLDFFEVSDSEYLIEEYIDGDDLRVYIDKFFRIDPFLAAHLFHHLVKGIAASHHVGVFHRDLKPSNIMLSSQLWPNQIKITDFGIAKMAESELDELIELGIDKSITTSATLVGALPYMAPELISTPKTAGTPADIWSAAAILYEILTGKKPFGDGLPAVTKIVTGELPGKPLVYGNFFQFGSFASQLWDLILKCLSVEPEGRPTADQLVNDCGTLCYSIRPRDEGTIYRYGQDAGAFGFIQSTAKPSESVFFHKDSYYGHTPKEGERVMYTAFDGGGSPRGFPIVPIR